VYTTTTTTMTTTILKYKDLTTEIQHMWNIKAKVILVITGATRTISKSFRQ
jgi:methanogenic corrinoid protein MtbC1